MHLDLGEQGIPNYFTQTLKPESFKPSQVRLLARVWCQNEHAHVMWAVFWIDEVCNRYNLFDEQMTQDVFDLNWHNVEADTCIVLHVKHVYELIFQPRIVVKCIYIEVLTILLFRTNNKEGIGRSKAVVLFLLIRCWLLLLLWGFVFVPCFVVHCYMPFLVLQSSWSGRERELVAFLVSCSSSSPCRSYSSILLRFSKRLWYGLSRNS